MTNNVMTPEQMMGMFTIKCTSTLNVEDIASKMQDACDKYKFSLLQTYNFFDILETKGFPIEKKVFVFEICQAKMASKILTANPEFSIFMPCRISVYEQGGTTVISTMNMEPILKVFEHNKEIYTEAVNLFNIIKELINSIK